MSIQAVSRAGAEGSSIEAEGLQHLFVALAGSDCKELWTLLVSFFGKGYGF